MRLIAKWIAQILTAAAACLSGTWTLVDIFHIQVAPNLFSIFGLNFNGEKIHVELGIRIILSGSAILLLIATDAFDIFIPRRVLRNARDSYLAVESPEWQAELAPAEIRISIWYARRLWYWPFWKVFILAWSSGYLPPHDADLALTLAAWQGISGQAYRSRERVSLGSPNVSSFTASEKWLLMNRFRMTVWQLRKTDHIKGLLSVPMLLDRGRTKPQKAVGVINLDSLTDAGAGRLERNKLDLAKFFVKQGKILAILDF